MWAPPGSQLTWPADSSCLTTNTRTFSPDEPAMTEQGPTPLWPTQKGSVRSASRSNRSAFDCSESRQRWSDTSLASQRVRSSHRC